MDRTRARLLASDFVADGRARSLALHGDGRFRETFLGDRDRAWISGPLDDDHRGRDAAVDRRVAAVDAHNSAGGLRADRDVLPLIVGHGCTTSRCTSKHNKEKRSHASNLQRAG